MKSSFGSCRSLLDEIENYAMSHARAPITFPNRNIQARKPYKLQKAEMNASLPILPAAYVETGNSGPSASDDAIVMAEFAIYSTGRREDDPLDAGLPHRIKNVEGPHHAVAKITARKIHAADDVGICGQVPDEIMSFDLENKPFEVENICFDKLESRHAKVVLNEFTATIRKIVVDGNPIPLLQEDLRNVAADEPGTASDENSRNFFTK